MIQNVNFLQSFLIACENKYYLQVYLDNYAYEIVNKQITDYLDINRFEDQMLQMLYYDRIDISEGNDLAKSNNNKECMICYYFFFNHGFKFRDFVCNACHDLTMLSVNIRDIAIITIKNVDYRCFIHNISKSGAINLLENSVLEDSGQI